MRRKMEANDEETEEETGAGKALERMRERNKEGDKGWQDIGGGDK